MSRLMHAAWLLDREQRDHLENMPDSEIKQRWMAFFDWVDNTAEGQLWLKNETTKKRRAERPQMLPSGPPQAEKDALGQALMLLLRATFSAGEHGKYLSRCKQKLKESFPPELREAFLSGCYFTAKEAATTYCLTYDSQHRGPMDERASAAIAESRKNNKQRKAKEILINGLRLDGISYNMNDVNDALERARKREKRGSRCENSEQKLERENAERAKRLYGKGM